MRKFVVLALVMFLSGCNSNIEEMELQLADRDKMIEELIQEVDFLSESAVSDDSDILNKENDELRFEIESLNIQIQELESEIATLENESEKEGTEHMQETLSVYDYKNGMLAMGKSYNSEETYNKLLIVGYGAMEWEHKLLDLTSANTPTIRIEVSGTLYNFKIEELSWNDDMTTYEVVNTVCNYDSISDTDILYDSVLAEGWPSELLSWKNNEGKTFYYLIGDNSLSGISYPYIIISELVNMPPWWEEN